jgi:hypothetical protein
MTTDQRNRLIIGVVLVAILGLVFLLTSNRRSETDSAAITPTTGMTAGATFVANSAIPGLISFGTLDGGHTREVVNYPQVPPAGGPHHPVWQNCGVYTERLKSEHAVHSLEHGAVWITYAPGLDGNQLDYLIRLTRQSTHRMLSLFEGLPAPIVASAWGYQLHLQKADDPRLLQFIAQFEQGPTTPERGAACDGGESRTARELGG